MNLSYVERQNQAFLDKVRPLDFSQGIDEKSWVGTATADDIADPVARRAMGFKSVSVA